MKNGELGLGGLEEEIITHPRPLPFASTENIAEGLFCLKTSSQF